MSWTISFIVVSVFLGMTLFSGRLWYRYRSLLKNYSLEKQRLDKQQDSQQKLMAELNNIKKEFEQHLLHDSVTGLPSRQVWEDRLQQTLFQSQRNELFFAIFLLNIDDFKIINNVLGHEAGEVLLKDVSSRLETCIRKVDSMCRFNDEKFAVLLPQMIKSETIAFVAKRLLEAIAEPFQVQEQKIFLTASIGIVTYPMNGNEINILLKNADNALHQAQVHGGNTYQFYSEDLYDLNRRELILNSSLHDDSIYQELVIYYQPQIDITHKEIFSMEALLRWQHPELGLVSPSEFLRIAEHTGRIVQIGDWVLRQACEQFQRWKAQGFLFKKIAVNVSLRQLESAQFTYNISKILQEVHLDPADLILEISESALLPKLELVEKSLRMLKHLRVQIAFDDFGTGYLSLQHLQRFSPNYLKIDNALTQNMTTDEDNKTIVKMISSLAQSLQYIIVAEGVENQQQRQLLESLGCFMMQGHLFSAPRLPREFNNKLIEDIISSVHQPILHN